MVSRVYCCTCQCGGGKSTYMSYVWFGCGLRLYRREKGTHKKTVTLEIKKDEVKLNSVYTRMLVLVFNSITLHQKFLPTYIFENFVL